MTYVNARGLMDLYKGTMKYHYKVSTPGNPLTKLREEHVNMRRILVLIELQLSLLEARQEPDFALLANGLYYMRKFPSIIHHPKEDMIFQRLLDLGAPLEQEIAEIGRQHKEIYALEDHLIELVLQLQAGNKAPLSRLIELGRHYLETQRLHAEIEERVLFPKALELFRQRDWKEVRARSEQIEDPLFGNSISERYQCLYDYLLKEAACNGASYPVTEQSAVAGMAITGSKTSAPIG